MDQQKNYKQSYTSSNQYIGTNLYSDRELPQFHSVNRHEIMQQHDLPRYNDSNLHWQKQETVSYRGGSDLSQFHNIKNILLNLKQDLNHKDQIKIDTELKDQFNQRIILLQKQIEGLMRRNIIFEQPDYQGGIRSINYNSLINQKQNQVIELEKKIQNLQSRLRKITIKQQELENQIVFLNKKIYGKNQLISKKQQQINHQIKNNSSMKLTLDSILNNVNLLPKNTETQKILKTLTLHKQNQGKVGSNYMQNNSINNNSKLKNQCIKLQHEIQNIKNNSNSIQDLQKMIQGWIIGLPESSTLKNSLLQGQKRMSDGKKLEQYLSKISTASILYQSQLNRLRKDNPGIKITANPEILDLLTNKNTQIIKVGNVLQVEKNIIKTVQVPVQDSQTKHLIHLFAVEMKRIFTQYPKLQKQINPKLRQYFSQELIDIIQVDQIDKIVDIVKYVPQVVKVQNTYNYNSQKTRKTQFHLRILLKALLEQMQKMKIKSGVVPQIDQGVVGMIRQEIMNVVNVEDILKVYRVVPKMVEVEKVIEKVVEKIVEVPKIIEIQRKVQTPIEVIKYQVVENTVNVPLQVPKVKTLYAEKLVEVPKYEQKIIEVPKIIEKIVEVVREVPKIVEVQKIVQRVIEKQKQIQVIRQVIVPIKQYINVQMIKQKIIPTQRIKQISIPVDRIIEKIVEVKIEVPKIIEIEKIVQKIVENTVYINAPQTHNHIEIKYQPIDRIVEKLVPIQKIVEKIVQVPQIVEKIVDVHHTINQPFEVQVKVQKPIYKDRIKQIQKFSEKIVPQKQIIQKPIDRIIQVPLIKEIIRIEKEIIKQPIVQTIQKIIHKQIKIQTPVILYQDKIVQVEKIINNVIKQFQPIHIKQQRIVEVEKITQVIKSVPVTIEKLIQKMVEVPKVVEVEKVVQKVVIVPRIVEKVVQVPKVVQKIVEKVLMQEKIKQIQIRVQVPVIQQKCIEIQVPRNIYIEIDRPIEVIQQKLVHDEIYHQNPKIHRIENEKIVIQTHQVPRTLQVDKIISHVIEKPEIFEIHCDKIIPIEIQIPVDIIEQKIIPVDNVRRQIVQVDRVVQKIIGVKVSQPQIIEIEKVVNNILIQQKIKQVQKIIPYVQQKIIHVDKVRQKIVPIQKTIQQLKQVNTIVEKVIDRVSEIPKIYQVQKNIDKRVDKPVIVEVEKMVPQIVHVNKYIDKIVEKIIEVPLLVQQLKQIDRIEQKIITNSKVETKIQPIDRNIEKEIIIEKLKVANNNVHLIQKSLQIADKVIQKPSQPMIVTEKKIVQVPHIVEKIVQKIVVMPQIVEVLKYVHQISQSNDIGMKVSTNIGQQQIKYKNIGNNLQNNMKSLLITLKQNKNNKNNNNNNNNKTSSQQQQLQKQIQKTQKTLKQLQQFIQYPRLHQIIHNNQIQKIVQKNHIIQIPVKNQNMIHQDLSKNILIEKLIHQLSQIYKTNPQYIKRLDQDIKLIFMPQFKNQSKSINLNTNQKLLQWTNNIHNKFNRMGGWTKDHQIMLNSFLHQRFVMANLVRDNNIQMERTKAISQRRLENLRRYKTQRDLLEQNLRGMRQLMPGIIDLAQQQQHKVNRVESINNLELIMNNFDKIIVGQNPKGQPTRNLNELNASRISSIVRQKEQEIRRLHEIIQNLKSEKVQWTKNNIIYQDKVVYRDKVIYQEKQGSHQRCEQKIRNLERELEDQRNMKQIKTSSINNNQEQLQKQIKQLQSRIRQLEKEIINYQNLKKSSNQNEMNLNNQLRQKNNRLIELQKQIDRYIRLEKQCKQNHPKQLKQSNDRIIQLQKQIDNYYLIDRQNKNKIPQKEKYYTQRISQLERQIQHYIVQDRKCKQNHSKYEDQLRQSRDRIRQLQKQIQYYILMENQQKAKKKVLQEEIEYLNMRNMYSKDSLGTGGSTQGAPKISINDDNYVQSSQESSYGVNYLGYTQVEQNQKYYSPVGTVDNGAELATRKVQESSSVYKSAHYGSNIHEGGELSSGVYRSGIHGGNMQSSYGNVEEKQPSRLELQTNYKQQSSGNTGKYIKMSGRKGEDYKISDYKSNQGYYKPNR